MASKAGRKLVDWDLDKVVQTAKSGAFVVFQLEGERSIARFIRRFGELWPEISERVLGVRLSLTDLRDHVAKTQQREFTDNALFHRGDKSERYSEFNATRSAVEAAWRDIKGLTRAPLIELDPNREFTNQQVRIATTIHGNKCYWCGAPFSEVVGLVGDHYIPHSKGGRTEQYNCVPSCQTCNGRKSDTMPDQFRLRQTLQAQTGRKLERDGTTEDRSPGRDDRERQEHVLQAAGA